MEVTKHFRFTKDNENDTDEDIECVELTLQEKVDPAYGFYTWPCALYLSQFLMYNQSLIKDKHILEIGAGTGVPSIVAAKLGAKVTISEGEKYMDCLARCRKICTDNGIGDLVKYIPLTWGKVNRDVISLPPVDYIIASDCFYDKYLFEDVIFTVKYFFNKNPSAKFWTTYQIRNSDYRLDYILMKWNIAVRRIPLSSFKADFDSDFEYTVNHDIQMFEFSLDIC